MAFLAVLVCVMSVGAVVASKPAQAQTGQSAVAEARSWIGTPYVWGGESRSGVDCSGLTQAVFGNLGVDLPRTTNAQWFAGSPSWYNGANAGDLVFSNFGGGWASHVGIATGDGTYIHAPYPGSVARESPIIWDNVNGVRSVI